MQGPPPLMSESDTVSLNGSIDLGRTPPQTGRSVDARDYPPLGRPAPSATESTPSLPPAQEDHFLDMRSLANACRDISLLDDKANRFAVLQDETCPVPQLKPKPAGK